MCSNHEAKLLYIVTRSFDCSSTAWNAYTKTLKPLIKLQQVSLLFSTTNDVVSSHFYVFFFLFCFYYPSLKNTRKQNVHTTLAELSLVAHRVSQLIGELDLIYIAAAWCARLVLETRHGDCSAGTHSRAELLPIYSLDIYARTRFKQ